MLNTANGPVEEALTRKELHKADEIQQEITKYFAEHYNSDGHTRMCSEMGGIEVSEVDKLLNNVTELFSSRNKAVSQDFIKDTSFNKVTYEETKQQQLKKTSLIARQYKLSLVQKVVIRNQAKTTNQNLQHNIQILIRDLLLNPQQYSSVFDAQQIYLMKGDSKALAACKPITIQSLILKIAEKSR